MVEGPIELRVHGVSGTPPEAMLDHPHVRRCAGDDEAGFYRRRYPDGLTPPGADRLEAYSWGGLTSGSSLRVLWLLLLPFTLVNVSHFMQPRELPAGDRRRRLLEAVLRLLALSLTLTLVLSVAGVAMDLAAWQCPAASATCSDRQVFLRFLGQGFWHQPGRRVALAALVPTALVWLLWYFGTRTWRGNEQVTRPQGTILAAPLPLQRRELWNGGEPVRRLRRVHVAAALAVVAALVAFPARQHLAAGRAWSGPGPLLGWLLLAGTAVVLAVAVVTVLLSRTARRPLPVGPVDSGGRPIPPLPVDGGGRRVPPLPVDSGETHTPPSATLPEGAPTTGDEAAGCPAPGEPAGGPGQPAGDREQDRERLLDRVLAANRVLAVALVPASMLYAGWPWPGAWEATGALPGFAPAIKALFLVQVVSVAVLLAATLAVRGRMRASASRPLAFAGFGLPVVASMGWMLAGGFAAGLSLRVADFLGTPVPTWPPGPPDPDRPACSSPCPTSGLPSAERPWPSPWPGWPCAWSCAPGGWANGSAPRWPSSTVSATTRGAPAGLGWCRSPGPAAGPWPATPPSATPPRSTPPPWPWSSSGPSSIWSTTGCPWRTGSRR
jgi:hypothetical protein